MGFLLSASGGFGCCDCQVKIFDGLCFEDEASFCVEGFM